MLDDSERRILADLERGLAHRSRRPTGLGGRLRVLGSAWWPLVSAVLGLVVAVFLVTLGLVGNALLLLAVAAAPSAWRVLRRLLRPGPSRPSDRS